MYIFSNKRIRLLSPGSLCFPKGKLNGREDVLKLSDIQRESLTLLNSLKENYFHTASEA
jgi:hypothetical protein